LLVVVRTPGMSDFDETDLEILRLLLADARRPYSEIADRVDLSSPTVSDRVDRLREAGVVRRFTLDVDRSTLTDGVALLVTLTVAPGEVDAVRTGLRDHEAVEHVFTTASGRVHAKVHVDPDAVRATLADAVDLGVVRELDVEVLSRHDWTPAVGTGAFDIECAECGNTVTDEGESVVLDGRRYHFCCGSCEEKFVERYEELEAGA
jgi:Lrp/AsnC family leucine-responsive transcriptional regulator